MVGVGFERACGALHHAVEPEVSGQEDAAGQAVCLAVALSRITQTEQQQNQHRLHGPTVWNKHKCSPTVRHVLLRETLTRLKTLQCERALDI